MYGSLWSILIRVGIWTVKKYTDESSWMRKGVKTLIATALIGWGVSIFFTVDNATDRLGVFSFVFTNFSRLMTIAAPNSWAYVQNIAGSSVFEFFTSLVNLKLWSEALFDIMLPIRAIAYVFQFIMRGLRWITTITGGLH